MVSQEKEAAIIAQYLIGKPDFLNKKLYSQAVKTFKINMGKRDWKIWNYVLNYPWLLPYVDAGLAFIEPENPIRQKIHIIFAILETEPSYSNFYIYKKDYFWIIKSGWFSLRALFRAITGFFIVNILILI